MNDPEHPPGGFPEDPLLDPAATPDEKAEQVLSVFQSLVATLSEEEAKAVSDRFSQAMTLVARREVLSAMENLRNEILQVLREAPRETPLVILPGDDEEEAPAQPSPSALTADSLHEMQERIAGSIRSVLYEAAGLNASGGGLPAGLQEETVRKLARGLTTTRLRRRRR